MASYRIEFKRSVKKDVAKIPAKDLKRIMDRIAKLADDPRPADSKSLSGNDKYRIRQGDYRILYAIEDDVLVIYVVKIGHRREVYRD